MEYLCKYRVHRVEILQGWSTTRTTHCDSGYDVTIGTYSLADLYLPNMKNALLVAPESNGLSCACAVWCHICSHPLNGQQEQRRKTLSLPYSIFCDFKSLYVNNVSRHRSSNLHKSKSWKNSATKNAYQNKINAILHHFESPFE